MPSTRSPRLSFEPAPNRIWRGARSLLESEHARYAAGETAVPYGTGAGPSNVRACGGACPFRFEPRCQAWAGRRKTWMPVVAIAHKINETARRRLLGQADIWAVVVGDDLDGVR